MKETLRKIVSPIGKTVDYIQNHFKAMLFLLVLFLLLAPAQEERLVPNNLQSIELTGPIFDTSEIVKELDDAASNDKLKGVMLVVDSPGGAVAPSLEVAYAVKRLREKKPVIVYAKGILASGSYYASIWADSIVANPGAMVGSIGVIMEGVNLQGLMHKIGVETQVVKAGKYKQVGTPDRPWTPYEKAEIDKVIKGTYEMFVHDVAKARRLDLNRSDRYANAHIFTAAQAKAVGLIDTVGVEYDARKLLEKRSGVKEPVWNEESEIERFFKKIGAESAAILHLYFPAASLR